MQADAEEVLSVLDAGFDMRADLWEEPLEVTHPVVFVAMAGPITDVKRTLFEGLVQLSPFPIVVGYDTSQRRADMNAVVKLARKHNRHLIPMNQAEMRNRYSSLALTQFAGSPAEAPSKFGALDWFVGSDYTHMWHIEDDTWVRNFTDFASKYAGNSADVIARGLSKQLPAWFDRGWMVGDKRHGLPVGQMNLMSLSVYRTSRRFAAAVIRQIKSTGLASHHEIFLPFVLSHTGLQFAPLHAEHSEGIKFNTNGMLSSDEEFTPLCVLRHSHQYVAHPVKQNCPKKCPLQDGKSTWYSLRKAHAKRRPELYTDHWTAVDGNCPGHDLTRSYETSLDDCTLACSACGAVCDGVSFWEGSNSTGFENCVLKSSGCDGWTDLITQANDGWTFYRKSDIRRLQHESGWQGYQ